MVLMLQLPSKPLYNTVVHAGAANTFQLVVTDSTAACVAASIATLSSSHFAWWAKLTVGLGIAAIVALLLCCLLMCFIRQKHTNKAKGTKWSLQQGGTPAVQAMSSVTQLAKHCSHVAAHGIAGLPPDHSVVSVPGFSSATETGTNAESGLMEARTSLGPPDVDHADMQAMCATGNLATSLGNASSTDGSCLSKKHCRQNAVNKQTRGAGSTASQHMDKPFVGTVASVPELSTQMLQMSLGEVELGPLLGQGAYGRVFKGT